MDELNCDVLVVGCGAAGLSSALSALEEGASVIVLERSPQAERGGNTRWTEALLRLNHDHSLRADMAELYASQPGYHVPPAMIRDMARPYDEWSPTLRALPFLDPEVLSAFLEGVPEVLGWIAGHGVRFQVAHYPMTIALPMPAVYGGGEAIIETLAPAVEAAGGRILYELTVTRLLLDETMGVTGVTALHSTAGGVNIRARKTILACGGFEGNPAMMAQYMGEQARFMRPVACGGWNNKGEGIRLALDIGAAPAGDYSECHRQPIDPRSSEAEPLVSAYPLGILVNARGERFMDEAPADRRQYLEEPGRQINRQPEGIGYFLFDSSIDDIPMWRRLLRTDRPEISADTLEELAAQIGVPADALSQTVASFNAACGSGTFSYARDDAAITAAFESGCAYDTSVLFDGLATHGIVPPKSNWARPIAKPPFGCFPIISSNTFTFGGLKVTADAQVVRTSGARIPGLYAAGETVGMMYGTYVGATSVLRALTFGRIAGRHAGRSVTQVGVTSRFARQTTI